MQEDLSKMNPKIDKSKLSESQLAQLEVYQSNQDQLQKLEDIAAMSHELVNYLSDIKSNKKLDELGTLVMDMRESLASINSKEAPEQPDTAKPVVDAMSRLEKALTAAIKSINVKPNVSVNAPDVKVDSPKIDLTGIQKELKALPKAFESAIKNIPQPVIPENDDTQMLNKLDDMLEWLQSIDTASRMKPQMPTILKVTNPDGTSIGSIPSEVEIKNDTGNPVPISGTVSVSTTGLATDTGQVLSVNDANNSTTTTLGSGATFTGTATDISEYSGAIIQVFSDKASATDGLKFETSKDGTNWDHIHSYTYSGGSVGVHYEETLPGNWFRVVYTNTNSAQTVFRLDTKITKVTPVPHVHPINYDISLDHPASIHRSVITGETTAGGGGLVNVKVNPSGTLETNATISSLPNEGQQTMANSISVAVASNQTAVPISAASLPLPSGASTAANQTTANTSLANIDTNTSKDASTFTFYSASLSAVATITPAAGKSIKIYKVLVTNSSNNATFRNVTLASTSLGTFLQGEAISSSWNITLAVDEVLTITPAGGTVYVNIQYKEI